MASRRSDLPGSAGSILLVEDDAAIAQVQMELMEMSGYRVWRVENGADAKTMLEQQRPDLIVLDLLLPDLDGLVLYGSLKQQTDVPILICSAVNQARERVLALKLRADDFIAKPFDIYEFETRIEAILRRSIPPGTRPQALSG